MSNTAEKLVKEAEGILEQSLLVPIILQKCAARGYTPANEEEHSALLKVASDIRTKIASGELAPVPTAQLTDTGELSKEAGARLAANPLAFGEEMSINMDEVDPQVKEAAAVATWGSLEALALETAKA